MISSRLTYGAWALGALLVFQPASFARTQISSVALGLYDNAEGSPVLDLIRQARSTLDMEFYEMDDPPVLAAIRDALDRGVVVHMVKEPSPVGASCKVFGSGHLLGELLAGFGPAPERAASCQDQAELVEDVTQAGGSYVPFTKPELCGQGNSRNCLQHGKMLVIDSSIAMVTSGNFNTTNLCDLKYAPKTCNRDYSYVTSDSDVVQTLETVVMNDTRGEAYDVGSVMPPGAESKITVGPDSLEPIVSFVDSAQKSIQLENQYLKDPTLNAALIAAANRGVKVELMVASACSFGTPRPSEKKKLTKIFSEFDDARIATRMFNKNMRINGKSGYLHAKAIVIDGKRAWMCSVNGSTQALTVNREFGVFFDDAQQVRKLASFLSSDFRNPKQESWQDSLNCAENH